MSLACLLICLFAVSACSRIAIVRIVDVRQVQPAGSCRQISKQGQTNSV